MQVHQPWSLEKRWFLKAHRWCPRYVCPFQSFPSKESHEKLCFHFWGHRWSIELADLSHDFLASRNRVQTCDGQWFASRSGSRSPRFLVDRDWACPDNRCVSPFHGASHRKKHSRQRAWNQHPWVGSEGIRFLPWDDCLRCRKFAEQQSFLWWVARFRYFYCEV